MIGEIGEMIKLNKFLKTFTYAFTNTVRIYCTKGMARVATVRCVENEEHLSISFHYSNANLELKERQYNLHRNKTEPLQSVKARIVANIERIGSRKWKKKKNKTDQSTVQESFNLPISVTKDDTTFSDDALCLQAFTTGTCLQIGDLLYQLKVNPPTITSISLPSNIMAGFYVFPKFEVEFANKTDCSFTWFRSTNIVVSDLTEMKQTVSGKSKFSLKPAKDWEKVGEHMCYNTSVEDIGRQLKVLCQLKSSNGESSFPVEALSTVPVVDGPGVCPFEKRHEFTKTNTLPGRFRLVSYNILADLYADSDFSRQNLFPSCPPSALNIDYRKQLLLKELLGYNADIICMQEVDIKVFENDLKPAFQSLNMTGMLDLKGGQVAEGLAFIYRDSKFKLVDNHRIILADQIQTCPLYENMLKVINQNDKLQERILKRTTALQVVILESLENPNFYICFGNTHLYFHPDADHVRLLQAAACVMHLEQVVGLLKLKNPDSEVAVILSGDFNSTPEFGVYQYLISQYIPEDHMDWCSNADEAVKNLSISHQFNMKSACGTPEYTNFTAGFVGCLDYIFIDDDKLEVEKIIPMPSDDDVKQHTAIPSICMPSDHIALACDLKIKSFKDKNIM